jgi:hypothetical protein
MPKTSFQPAQHGFHFSNRDIQYSFNLMNGRELCGGMSFASLDFFHHQMPIPSTRVAPAVGTPLNNYILRRQIQAHHFAIPRLISGGASGGNSPFESCLRVDQSFGIVKRMINSGRPVPILLSAEGASLSTNSHWVVAIGFESMPTSTYGCEILSKLYIYDNAQPDIETELIPEWGDNNFRLQGSRRRFAYYAPFGEYSPIRPTPQEMAVPANPSFSVPGGII